VKSKNHCEPLKLAHPWYIIDEIDNRFCDWLKRDKYQQSKIEFIDVLNGSKIVQNVWTLHILFLIDTNENKTSALCIVFVHFTSSQQHKCVVKFPTMTVVCLHAV
jgi:hypothetical protein